MSDEVPASGPVQTPPAEPVIEEVPEETSIAVEAESVPEMEAETVEKGERGRTGEERGQRTENGENGDSHDFSAGRTGTVTIFPIFWSSCRVVN